MNDEQLVEEVLRKAKKPPEPPKAAKDRVKMVARAEWQGAVARRRRAKTRKFLRVASAAMFMMVIGGAGLFSGQKLMEGKALLTIATVESGSGEFRVNGAKRGVGAELKQGDRLDTASSGVSLALQRSIRIAIDASSSIEVISSDEIRLIDGRLYFESPNSGAPIYIDTILGRISDIGTRYSIRSHGEELEVAVREGEVQIETVSAKLKASAKAGVGDWYKLNRSGLIESGTVLASDESWNWQLSSQQPLELEGISAFELIEWSAYVSGKEVFFASLEAKRVARETRFSGGRVQANDIVLTLPRILRTTKLYGSVNKDTIIIELITNN